MHIVCRMCPQRLSGACKIEFHRAPLSPTSCLCSAFWVTVLIQRTTGFFPFSFLCILFHSTDEQRAHSSGIRAVTGRRPGSLQARFLESSPRSSAWFSSEQRVPCVPVSQSLFWEEFYIFEILPDLKCSLHGASKFLYACAIFYISVLSSRGV